VVFDQSLALIQEAQPMPTDCTPAHSPDERQALREHADFVRRMRFRPFAFIIGQPMGPGYMNQIIKRVFFDPRQPIKEIHQTIQDEIRRREERWNVGATGYVIHFTPDRRERFDLNGRLLEVIDRV
jgi:hypothetical protein